MQVRSSNQTMAKHKAFDRDVHKGHFWAREIRKRSVSSKYINAFLALQHLATNRLPNWNWKQRSNHFRQLVVTAFDQYDVLVSSSRNFLLWSNVRSFFEQPLSAAIDPAEEQDRTKSLQYLRLGQWDRRLLRVLWIDRGLASPVLSSLVTQQVFDQAAVHQEESVLI